MNSKALDERLRAHGCSLWPIERPFDRVVGLSEVTVLVEYKNPETYYGRAGLTSAQQAVALMWRGGLVHKVSTVEDADRLVAWLRSRGRALRRHSPEPPPSDSPEDKPQS